jgi:hypothetical protein
MIKVNDKGFVYATEGFFLPPLNIKQLEIFNDPHRYLLVHGPRMSGKTFGIIHKVLRHAFDIDGAMVAIVCKTLKNAKSAGVWLLLCRMIKFWETKCYGFKVVEGPKTAGDTKLSFIRIRNRHGTISEIQCHSLEHAQEVEAKFKSSGYSMFWLSELDQFCTEHAFDIFCDALRMTPFVPFEQHQIICDCNPPDTGTNNWIHDKWFKFKDAEPKADETEKAKIAKSRLHRILVMIEDNPQLSPEAKDDLIERYRNRPTWYNRFVLGIWEMAILDGHFSEVWDEDKHVLGNANCPEDDQEIIIPTSGCRTLLTGWDMGDKNHAFLIIEKITNEDPITRRQVVSFTAIDEVVVVRTFMLIEDFVGACLERIEYWERWQLKQHNITLNWRHWSDTSAFERKAQGGTSDAAIAFEASDGRIVLDGAPKYRGSNRDKVNLLSELLGQGRLHISAQLFSTRAMFANLKKGSGAVGQFVANDDHKHPFDALAYPIIAEAPSDMLQNSNVTTAKKESVPGLIVARM